MDMMIFCTVFIFQFVGHRIGDYLIQTHSQALNKSTSKKYRFRHCLNYSLVISLLIFILFSWKISLLVFILTFPEHYWIDSRTPVVKFKDFFERILVRNPSFNIDEFPNEVLTGVDQTIHYLRIFLISILLAFIL